MVLAAGDLKNRRLKIAISEIICRAAVFRAIDNSLIITSICAFRKFSGTPLLTVPGRKPNR
jgi:hypothetical protein